MLTVNSCFLANFPFASVNLTEFSEKICKSNFPERQVLTESGKAKENLFQRERESKCREIREADFAKENLTEFC